MFFESGFCLRKYLTVNLISNILQQYKTLQNGYTAKLNHLKNCVANPVIKLPTTATVNLDKDCNLVMIGCVEITKPFKTAKVLA